MGHVIATIGKTEDLIMENCSFVKKNNIVENNERTYVGHISCPAFLDDWKWILNQSGPFTLVLPPVRQHDLAKAKEIIKTLASSNKNGLELSVNDFGLLKYVLTNFPEIPLAAGPLLFSQDSDPLITSFFEQQTCQKSIWNCYTPAVVSYKPPSEACKQHWAEPSVFTNSKLLKEMGVSRLEICSQPIIPVSPPELPVTTYDFGILSVRPCTGNCENCCSTNLSSGNMAGNSSAYMRSGREIKTDKNLLYYHGGNIPLFTDRIVSLKRYSCR